MKGRGGSLRTEDDWMWGRENGRIKESFVSGDRCYYEGQDPTLCVAVMG